MWFASPYEGGDENVCVGDYLEHLLTFVSCLCSVVMYHVVYLLFCHLPISLDSLVNLFEQRLQFLSLLFKIQLFGPVTAGFRRQ